MLKDKYNMTSKQNVFFAKRNIVESIWKSSHIEKNVNTCYNMKT